MMIILGITGGVGSGKSRVLSYLEEKYQAVTAEMDRIGRELMEPEGECFAPAAELFPEALGSDGRLDRSRIAAAVFGNEELLGALNAIIHPAVRRACEKAMAGARAEGRRLFVMESAILLEAGYAGICQDIWYVRAEIEVRRQRLRESRGYSDLRTEQIMASQLSEEAYLAGCDFCLDNSGDFSSTANAIDQRLAFLFSKEPVFFEE